MTITVAQLAEQVGEACKKQHLLIATAESCTGGGLSYWLTSVPGSSLWFECGFVTYSDRSKTELLAVKEETIKKYGAVSCETAKEMAMGALTHSHAHISMAITGIAGPSGGTVEKPVGTVWLAWNKRDNVMQSHGELFTGDRQLIRQKVIEKALRQLLLFVT